MKSILCGRRWWSMVMDDLLSSVVQMIMTGQQFCYDWVNSRRVPAVGVLSTVGEKSNVALLLSFLFRILIFIIDFEMVIILFIQNIDKVIPKNFTSFQTFDTSLLFFSLIFKYKKKLCFFFVIILQYSAALGIK